MSKSHIAANGQEISNEMIDRWCDSYEQGEFPEGESMVGTVACGQPLLFSEGVATVEKSVTSFCEAMEFFEKENILEGVGDDYRVILDVERTRRFG